MTPIRLCVSLPIVHWVEPKHTHTRINLHSLHDDDGGGGGDSKAAGWRCGSDERTQSS